MAEKSTLNYPDVFGYITDAPRHAVGVVQVALAVRPGVVRAGRPFEVIMLIQNASDAPVDVRVALQVPEKDAAGQKGKFITGVEHLVVGIAPAEVGYVTLPMSTLPDTAVGNNYSIGMDISVKPLEKPNRVRDPEGGSIFNPGALSAEKRQIIEDLKKLTFSTQKRGFLRGNALETNLSILAGKVGTPLKLKPGWTSLWTLEDQNDTQLLLEKHREAMRVNVLPKLRRRAVYEPLLQKTRERFDQAGYPLRDVEAGVIARLLTLILEFANASKTSKGAFEAGIYNLEPRLAEKRLNVDESQPLPRWATALLRAAARDERVLSVPVRAIPHFAYNDLLVDGMIYSFKEIEKATGHDLGTDDEMVSYAEMVVEKLGKSGEMDFSHAYMPLVIGGILICDQMLLPDERLGDLLDEIKYLLEEHEEEQNEENEMIFEIAQTVIEHSLRKYGALDNRY